MQDSKTGEPFECLSVLTKSNIAKPSHLQFFKF